MSLRCRRGLCSRSIQHFSETLAPGSQHCWKLLAHNRMHSSPKLGTLGAGEKLVARVGEESESGYSPMSCYVSMERGEEAADARRPLAPAGDGSVSIYWTSRRVSERAAGARSKDLCVEGLAPMRCGSSVFGAQFFKGGPPEAFVRALLVGRIAGFDRSEERAAPISSALTTSRRRAARPTFEACARRRKPQERTPVSIKRLISGVCPQLHCARLSRPAEHTTHSQRLLESHQRTQGSTHS